MLEDYYVEPSTNDRVRANWVAPQIDKSFSDVENRDVVAVGIAGRNPKDAVGQEDPLRVVTKRAPAEVGEKSLGFVKPTVDGKLIVPIAAEFSSAALRVLNGRSHR